MTLLERTHPSLDRVIAESAAANIVGVSTATLRRMVERGEGPSRIKLSTRRIGYRLSAIEDWLRSRGEIAGA
jgi:predicted DNA-binding transcriptional regulator AlpA